MKAGSRIKIENNYILLNKSNKSPYTKDDHKIKFKKHKTNHSLPTKFTSFTIEKDNLGLYWICLLYTSPSPRDRHRSRMPSSA